MNVSKIRISRCWFATAILALLAASSIAAEPLAWKFTAGEVFHYRTTTDRHTTIDLGDAGKESRDIDHVVDMTWTVQQVQPDGAAVLTQKIDRIQLKLATPKEEPVVLDSTATAEPQGFTAMVSPLLKEIVKSEVKVTVSPRGEVTAVKAPESLITALENSVGKDLLGDLATKKGFETLARTVTLELPKTLDAGAKWTTKVETVSPLLGTVTAETTYKYEGPKEVDGLSLEAITPTIAMKFKDSPIKIAVADEKSSGEILFNRAAGRLESSKVEHSMQLTIESQGEEIKQQIEQTIETKWAGEK